MRASLLLIATLLIAGASCRSEYYEPLKDESSPKSGCFLRVYSTCLEGGWLEDPADRKVFCQEKAEQKCGGATKVSSSLKRLAQPQKGALLPYKKRITSPLAPAPIGPYSQGIQASSFQTIYLSGQIAIDQTTGQIVGGNDITLQTEQVMKNIGYVLKAAGLTFKNVVKTSVFLTDLNDFSAMNTVYANYFNDEAPPARSCVQISKLPKEALVEIECIAVRGI